MKEIIKKYSNQDTFMDAKEKIEKILKGTPHTIEEYFHHKKNAHKDNTTHDFDSYIKVKLDENQIEKIKEITEIPS